VNQVIDVALDESGIGVIGGHDGCPFLAGAA
jgi:hypothetical protein